jgi:hypothetical protein
VKQNLSGNEERIYNLISGRIEILALDNYVEALKFYEEKLQLIPLLSL